MKRGADGIWRTVGGVAVSKAQQRELDAAPPMTHSSESPDTYDQQVSDLAEMEPVAWQYRYRHKNPSAIWSEWGPYDPTLHSYLDWENEERATYPASAIERLRAEIDRLNKWADGFSDAQLKERRLAEERIKAAEAERDSLVARVEEIRRETLEEAAKLIEQTQEATSLRTNKRSLVERSEGNLVGLAYAERLRALKEKA